MPRHARYLPHGVIPAVLLPFNDDLSIDEKGFRGHLRDVAATKGLSAITINAHSTEVASCSFEEQRRVLAIAQDEIGERLPLVNGVWADGSIEAGRIARMAAKLRARPRKPRDSRYRIVSTTTKSVSPFGASSSAVRRMRSRE